MNHGPGPVNRHTGWVQDPRLAAIVWSRLTETSDVAAQKTCHHLGVQTAVELTLAGHPPPQCVLDESPHGQCEPLTDPRVGRALGEALERWQARVRTLNPDRDLDLAHRAQAQLLLPDDPQWPCALDDLRHRRPVLLWVRGTLPPEPGVALVGSRSCTAYGRRAAAELAAGVAAHGYDVISGAALGIDAAAHRGALAAGTTTAVLACGIDRVYPLSNTDLVEGITASGAVVSESPPGSTPTRWRFLERNRLIAGLGRATVVVEAALRSGALNTATHTRDLLRPLGAVPGPITSAASAGCHRLIRDGGAVCITGADDIHELAGPMGTAAVPIRHTPARVHDHLDPVDLRVWEVLSPGRGLTVAQLAVGAGMSPQQTRAVLGRLSGDGLAVRGSGTDGVMTWRRARTR